MFALPLPKVQELELKLVHDGCRQARALVVVIALTSEGHFGPVAFNELEKLTRP
jgi:hypothetical protein